MKKKKISEHLPLIILLVFIMTLVCNVAFATSSPAAAYDDAVMGIANQIVGILLVIGSAACVGKCIQIGIMYMSSSAVDKSNAKAAIMPWLVGAILLACFVPIANTVINIISEGMKDSVLDY